MLKDKQKVFEYLNSTVNKKSKRENVFKKLFPELYQEFLKVDFPEELKNLPFKQRLWHFLKDDYSTHTCKICGGKVSFSKNKKFEYNIYCCVQCAIKDNTIKNKRKQTCLEKYGVENYSSTKECRKKVIETNFEKFGEENPFKSKKIKEKIKETNLKKYGVEYYSQTDESKERIKQTNLEKYGVEYYSQTDEFKNKVKITCIEKYGVENYTQTEEYKEKCKQTCLEKYGVEHYSQTQECQNKMKDTCLEKYGVEHYTFSNEFIQRHDEIKEKEYQTKKKNNSFNSSLIEEEFREYLTNNNIEFIPYYKSDLYPFECDFYLPYYDLYIEINGHWTHGEHPFNPNNIEDIELLEGWKSKCKIIDGKKNQYFNAVNVWSQRDPLKRKTAKENNLNYLEIFSDNIDDVVNFFKKHLSM